MDKDKTIFSNKTKQLSPLRDEEYLSKVRALELWNDGLIDNFEVGTFKGLSDIHKYLFQDIFEFAGKKRTVNLAKGNFRFCPVIFLDDTLKTIEKMPESTFEEIIDKYVEMNVAHPFREGNGRSTRIWLDMMLKKNLSLCIDWSKIDRYDYLQAMERSPINALELTTLLNNAITDLINDRTVYMRGIQASYIYENLNKYDINNILDSYTK